MEPAPGERDEEGQTAHHGEGGRAAMEPALGERDEACHKEALEGPLPEEQGVLFFSASQDYQPAQELPEDARLGKHGAFTWAFLQTLATAGDNERVDRIFQRTFGPIARRFR